MNAIPPLLLLLATVVMPGCASSPQAADTAAEVPTAHEEPPSATAELENAFWACDYIATTHGVRAAPMAACRLATESLQREKFSGSLPAMLEWWRANKAARHREMQRRLD